MIENQTYSRYKIDREEKEKRKSIRNLGIPAWTQGALRSSASSLRLFKLSVLSGRGGGVGVEPCVLPSAGTELLDVLI